MHLKSIKTKLSLYFGALLIFICAGLAGISYSSSEKALSSTIDESLSQLAKVSSKAIHEEVNSQFNALEALAEINLLGSNELSLEAKLDLLEDEVKRSGHISMGIADLNGNVKFTDGSTANISDRDYYKKALEGAKNVSDPIISKINNSVIISFAVPIKDGNSVRGVLVATRDGNSLSDFTNNIHFGKNGEAFMISETGITVAHKDRNTVMEMYSVFEDAKKNNELKPLVDLEGQMIEGKEGMGEYTYKGITKYMAFAPVEGTKWSLAITAPKDEAMEKIEDLAILMLIISLVFIAISIIIIFIIAAGLSKPIGTISRYLKIVAEGDFTKEVPAKLLKRKDETGALASAMCSMQASIRNIIKEVIDKSDNVSQMLININREMEHLRQSIEGISATTQQLSAGTEETASSAEEMSATSMEIEKAVESIASKAQEGAITVNNLNKMSEIMKQNATESKENTVGIYVKTKDSLRNAIEQSKAVDQINNLSEAILEITSQTNLLALNAAIEAARAGEAGRGFAVVADEIRTLAVDSKNTVTRIQEVTKVILEAVNNLSASSGEMLDFVDQQVLNDYEKLVESSEKYSQNTSSINDMVTDFSATSEELLASVQNMVKAIDEMAGVSNEEAQGATNIAQEASCVTQMANNVSKIAESAKGKSEMLIQVVSQFKV